MAEQFPATRKERESEREKQATLERPTENGVAYIAAKQEVAN
jgi:hypothetical protein